MSFEEDMTEHEDSWSEAQENAGANQLLPDGLHQANIKISRVEQKDWGWEFALMFANQDGTAWSNINLDNDKGVEIAARVAKTLGYDGPVTGLKDFCETGAFLDVLCDIKVVTKPGETRDFTNVYVLRAYLEENGGADVETRPGPASDDIPF